MHVFKIFALIIYSKLFYASPLFNPLPRFLINTADCPLNACEVVKIFAEHLFNAKVTEDGQLGPSLDYDGSIETDETIEDNRDEWDFGNGQRRRQKRLEARIADVERRLRSVEQPLWKVVPDTDAAWDKCTESVCRCQPSIKSLSCWRTGINVLPDLLTIPSSIIKM